MLKLTDINRKLGAFSLTDINLEISEGEYYVLLGRSGSGKTQLMELIAGLGYPDSGRIILDNVDITHQRIQDRKIGIVFQDYAVFPHMTVYGNIAYPLKVRREDKKSIKERVENAAFAMNITHILKRDTENLSGGELQRVALARTLITSPRLLLLDEPFSCLDTSLKDDLRRLLRNLNKAGQTIIHVTHDYNDAMSLAKKVGVIHNGSIIQEGSVDEVFKNPTNRFVARYAGIRNFFKVEIFHENGSVTGLTQQKVKFRLEDKPSEKNGLLIIKNDSILLSRAKPDEVRQNILQGKISEIIPYGSGMEITIDAGDLFYVNLPVKIYEEQQYHEGENVWISFPADAIVILKGNM